MHIIVCAGQMKAGREPGMEKRFAASDQADIRRSGGLERTYSVPASVF